MPAIELVARSFARSRSRSIDQSEANSSRSLNSSGSKLATIGRFNECLNGAVQVPDRHFVVLQNQVGLCSRGKHRLGVLERREIFGEAALLNRTIVFDRKALTRILWLRVVHPHFVPGSIDRNGPEIIR